MIPLFDTLLPGTTGAVVTVGPETLVAAALLCSALVRIGVEVREELRRQAAGRGDARPAAPVATAAPRLAA
jgi:hypothetical protein